VDWVKGQSNAGSYDTERTG
jgi:hypothetical protein